ncbi:MAG: hypothetical protein L6R42_003021, partial [Xanthoria sp. 1 TBL-2021]
MAYPRGQFQQPPSTPSFGGGQTPHVYQQQQQQHTYQHAPQSRNRHERAFQEFSSHPDRNLEESHRSGPNYGSPQWPEQSADWSSEAQQPYTNQREYAGPTPTQMRPRQGAYQDQMYEQNSAGHSPAAAPYSQDQNTSWNGRSPQIPGQPQHFHQPRGYGLSSHPNSNYDGTGPHVRTNGHHAPVEAESSNGNHDRAYRNPPVSNDPQSQFDQQQRSRPVQDGRSKNAGRSQGITDTKPQQHVPSSSSGRPKKSTKEQLRMNRMSPETISWDSPFPTFPKSNKKNNHLGANDLNNTMANTSIHDRLNSRQAESNRPSAVEKQTSSDSSRNNGQGYPQRPSQERIAKDDHQILDRRPAGGRSVPGPQNGYNPIHQSFDQAVMPPEGSRPRTDHGRNSEDRGDHAFRQPRAYQGDSQRSKTMPNTISEAMSQSQPLNSHGGQVPIQDVRHRLLNEQGGRGYQSPAQSHSSTTRTYPRSQSFEDRSAEQYQDANQRIPNPHLHTHHQHAQQSSLGDFFDSYYHIPHHSDPNLAQRHVGQPTSPPDEDMPNFDNIPATGASHMHGLIVDDHLYPQQTAPALPPMPPQPVVSRRSPPVPRTKAGFAHSRSSPNLREERTQRTQQYSDGFDFELPGSVPAMYSRGRSPSRDGYESNSYNHTPHRRPWPQNAPEHPAQGSARSGQAISQPGTSEPHIRQPFSRPPDGQSRPSMSRGTPSQDSQSQGSRKGPSPIARHGPASPAVDPQIKPDALPAHPAPVRAGLMSSPPANQPSRPPPVRQYSAGLSSYPQTSSSPKPQISRPPREKSEPVAVTHEGFERLRQSTRRNPSDNQTQLLLAKKLVEAASVLADDGGRADAKTTSKNRERFNSEAYKLVKKLIQNGYPEASFYLGDCYSRGSLGLQTDAKEAFSQYQSAAKAGHAQAAYRVAVCCEMGLEEGGGTKRDALKAMQWYQRAATLGDTPAMYKMGVIQLKGLLGQPKNASAALSWLQRAAKQADEENPHALHELALLYESPNSIEGLRKDEEHAKQLFFEAANLGYKFSQFRLGCAFEYGLLGCPIDPRQSIAWYSKAAVQDEHQS